MSFHEKPLRAASFALAGEKFSKYLFVENKASRGAWKVIQTKFKLHSAPTVVIEESLFAISSTRVHRIDHVNAQKAMQTTELCKIPETEPIKSFAVTVVCTKYILLTGGLVKREKRLGLKGFRTTARVLTFDTSTHEWIE